MGSIIRFDKNDLILMCIVQWPCWIRLDRKVKHRHSCFYERNNEMWVGSASTLLSDDICSPESKLRVGPTWQEYRAVIDCDSDDLLIRNS